ncbi:MAG: hypothetical protein R3B90_04785 [Planctomycetaceae bacterium]
MTRRLIAWVVAGLGWMTWAGGETPVIGDEPGAGAAISATGET